MRRIRVSVLVAFFAVIAAAGCGRQASGSTSPDDGPIRAAINAHLLTQKNLDTSAFDTEIQKTTIQGDTARADVVFHLKGGPAMMQLSYDLKKANGKWDVVQTNPVLDPQHPSVDGTDGTGAAAAPGPAPDIFDAVHQQLRTLPSNPPATAAKPK